MLLKRMRTCVGQPVEEEDLPLNTCIRCVNCNTTQPAPINIHSSNQHTQLCYIKLNSTLIKHSNNDHCVPAAALRNTRAHPALAYMHACHAMASIRTPAVAAVAAAAAILLLLLLLMALPASLRHQTCANCSAISGATASLSFRQLLLAKLPC
jgi:hypothetical protein